MKLLNDFSVKCSKHPTLLRLTDSGISLFVIFPSTVAFFRGVNDLGSVYFISDDKFVFGQWMCTLVGACSILSYAFLPIMDRYLSRDRKILYVIVTRTGMYVNGVLLMLFWRGVWGLLDHYLNPYGWKAGMVGFFVSYCIQLLTMTSRYSIVPPFVVCLDTEENILQASSRLQTKFVWGSKSSALKYALDSILTQWIFSTLTIVTWRSGFAILEEFFFPGSGPFLSNMISLLLGIALAISLFAFESIFAQVARRIETSSGYMSRTIFDDVIHTAAFVSMSFLWRGAWFLNSKYVIEDPLIGGWVNHVIGTILLISLQVLSVVGGCGCPIDGDDIVTSQGGFFRTEYLRRLLQSDVASSDANAYTELSDDEQKSIMQ